MAARTVSVTRTGRPPRHWRGLITPLLHRTTRQMLDSSRRSLLSVFGTVITTGLSGCAALGSSDDEPTDQSSSDGASGSPSASSLEGVLRNEGEFAVGFRTGSGAYGPLFSADDVKSYTTVYTDRPVDAYDSIDEDTVWVGVKLLESSVPGVVETLEENGVIEEPANASILVSYRVHPNTEWKTVPEFPFHTFDAKEIQGEGDDWDGFLRLVVENEEQGDELRATLGRLT